MPLVDTGSGFTFSAPYNWVTDEQNGVPISSERMEQRFTEVETALTQVCLVQYGGSVFGRRNSHVRVNDFDGTNYLINAFFGFSGNPIGAIHQVASTGVLQYSTVSDRRIKNNIAPLASAMETIKPLEVCSYTMQGAQSPTVGLVAQQVAEHLPAIVSRGDTAETLEASSSLWSVDYPGLIPYLLKAVQELEARIAQLETA